jgi:hypothetical protein
MSDSVPPLVTFPTTEGPPPRSLAAAPTSAFSIAEQGWEGGRVEAVDVCGERVRGGGELVQSGDGGVVDVGEEPPAVGRQVVFAQRADLCEHLRGRHSGGGQRVEATHGAAPVVDQM